MLVFLFLNETNVFIITCENIDFITNKILLMNTGEKNKQALYP